MKAQHTEPGSDLKSTLNQGLESNLTMTKYGQSGTIRSHVSDPAPGRRAPRLFGQALDVTTHNAWTLADTILETNRDIRHKLQRDLDTNGNINRETRHLCENMLPYHARY